jgi:hypothetical protein
MAVNVWFWAPRRGELCAVAKHTPGAAKICAGQAQAAPEPGQHSQVEVPRKARICKAKWMELAEPIGLTGVLRRGRSAASPGHG